MNFKFLLACLLIALSLSCKKTSDNRSKSFELPTLKETVSTLKTDTLSLIKISVATNQKWIYDEKNSQLNFSEKQHYIEKVTYEKMGNDGDFKTLSYIVAKDDVVLSLTGGLEGALSNMAVTSQAELVEREDIKMASHYGYESVLSKGKLKSKVPNMPDLNYRLLLLINKSEMYFVLGLFSKENENVIKDFENEINSIKILNLNS